MILVLCYDRTNGAECIDVLIKTLKRFHCQLGEFYGKQDIKSRPFAALATGALWVLPMNAWAVPVFPEGISTDGESLAGKTWEDALHTAEEEK